MALTDFAPPGNASDLSSRGRRAWSKELDALFRRQVAAVGGTDAQFFNPLSVDVDPDATIRVLRWGAFPRKLARLPAPNRWTLGEVRDRQEEYCEWVGVRDRQGRLIRAMFTTEVPTYYHLLAADDPDRLVEVYRDAIGPTVQRRDLVGPTGGYRERNAWNLAGAMHMVQVNNTLPAAVILASQSTVVKTIDNLPVVNANDLIRCGVVADADRNSDPLIVGEVNAMARRGARISLADPVGLYLDRLRTEGWVAPDGADPATFWTVTRGDREHAVRAVYQVPDELGFTISDIRIDGVGISSPSQIAESLEVKLTGLAHQFGAPVQAQDCRPQLPSSGDALGDGAGLAAAELPSLDALLAASRNTR
jgi:hypothetical protein